MFRPFLIVCLSLAAAFPLTAGDAAPQTEKDTELVLPRGDPVAGRAALMDLYCTSCHLVAGGNEMPKPVSASQGPTLDPDHGRQQHGELAMSILAPSHRIGEEVAGLIEGSLSPMGDYSQAMTVRQLLDLVAYLDSLDEGV